MTDNKQTLITEWNKQEFLPNHTEDLDNALKYYEGSNDAESFIDWYRETYINSVEILYYASAMDFLRQNDPSLQESLQLVNEWGYTWDNLNSEVLASILLQEYLTTELSELEDDIQDYFDNVIDKD
jgi:hypothetical protein